MRTFNRSIALGFAMEDVQGEVVGKTEQEVEHVWWGQLPQDGQLGELSKQAFVTRLLQEQCSGKLAFNPDLPKESTELRARRINRTEAVLTSKTYVEGVVGMREKSTELTPEQFQFYQELFGYGIAKMRYTIDLLGFDGKLQLDVFVDAYGHPIGGAKYDYEVPITAKDGPLPPLPITLINQQYWNPFEPTDEGRAAMRAFMGAQRFRYT